LSKKQTNLKIVPLIGKQQMKRWVRNVKHMLMLYQF